MESVILNSPFLLLLYGGAILLTYIGFKRKSVIASALAVIICLLGTGYLVLKGATFNEIIVILLIFLAIKLSQFMDKEGNR